MFPKVDTLEVVWRKSVKKIFTTKKLFANNKNVLEFKKYQKIVKLFMYLKNIHDFKYVQEFKKYS